ncbi:MULTISPECIES: transporter substrate-binding domain-containing protein [Pseudonocardia]|uniref:Lysine-arginine-ornithine-binding periplasmic protein n=2 Tax=Pseudonocardia TaxID=1847 RepID=A0A1Y2N8U9_PSEAH|nr:MULTISPECIES: transporter substrate-binding domain-containing protein [Pseudonocardia]OSY43497.1 Lysine-arginine-ornithine-binding periplasmic protein precursor [Pseudonocardia autotrophica]TDN73509.1 amino acid ABC transporter substrate-binding protein (PAAT family) [Pseudonocardia autotrophica]BBG04253.1 ectoine/hydroxyectoine ABC transporter substrate-binding protein EhuB [Pseudonocardia autotrophica]GEC25604.1 ectoine/hydroxyectoine ABC transporter substrate-binding protein EhuB [Pseudon
MSHPIRLSRRRLLGTAAVLGGAAIGLAGCGRESADALTRLRAGGDLVVGLSGERPFGFTDGVGRPTGEGPEVARAVAAGLGGAGLVAVQVPFERLVPDLLDQRFDLISVGLTITPLRCQQVAFSRPDYVARTALLVPTGNPLGVATLGGVRRTGATLGVLRGSAEFEYALAAGIGSDRIVQFDSQGALVRGVGGREAQVGALTRISLLDEVRRNAGIGLQVTPGFAPEVNGRPVVGAGAFAFRPADTELRAEFDRELTALQESGRWLELVRPFGFTEENLPPRDLTVDDLCARTPES